MRKQLNLLIVDDEMYAIQGVKEGVNWDTLDYGNIYEAFGYQQAIDILSEHPIHVALCDIEMPDESGLELVDWINQHSPKTLCMILSCHDEFDLARQALQLKCFDYILKPARYEELTRKLAEAAEEVYKSREDDTLMNYGKLYVDRIAEEKVGDVKPAEVQAAEYIDRNLSENLSVSRLAEKTYVSRDNLTRRFKKKYGTTVVEYIYRKRMTLAGELLKDSRMTITMTADAAGYSNYSYFTEQFRKFYGMTPSEYQKAYSTDK